MTFSLEGTGSSQTGAVGDYGKNSYTLSKDGVTAKLQGLHYSKKDAELSGTDSESEDETSSEEESSEENEDSDDEE